MDKKKPGYIIYFPSERQFETYREVIIKERSKKYVLFEEEIKSFDVKNG